MSAEFYLAGLAALVAAAALYKIWRAHQMLFRLQETAEDARAEVSLLFGQIQAMLALERTLGLSRPLPPMRGWAGSPDFLLHVHHALRDRHPRVVLECGSGVSTIVGARTLQMIGSGHVYSLEHEPEYARKTRSLIAEHGLKDWATVLDAPLVEREGHTPWYDVSALDGLTDPIDVVVIDGPPAAVARRSRAPALALLKPRLAKSFLLILDDADRPDEQEIVRQWMNSEPRLVLDRLPAEKGCVTLRAEASP